MSNPREHRYQVEIAPNVEKQVMEYGGPTLYAEIYVILTDQLSWNPRAFPEVPPVLTWRAIKTDPIGDAPGFVFGFQINEDDRIVRVVFVYARPARK